MAVGAGPSGTPAHGSSVRNDSSAVDTTTVRTIMDFIHAPLSSSEGNVPFGGRSDGGSSGASGRQRPSQRKLDESQRSFEKRLLQDTLLYDPKKPCMPPGNGVVWLTFGATCEAVLLQAMAEVPLRDE